MAANVILPEGFVLDEQPDNSQFPDSSQLPDGFVLDAQPEQQQSPLVSPGKIPDRKMLLIMLTVSTVLCMAFSVD